MLNPSYSFKFHSFVDLITNSSTEIYIKATDHTIASVKSMIDHLCKMVGSDKRADDLFEFSLEEQEGEDDYYKKVDMVVKCRDEASEDGKAAANLLSQLAELFSMSAEYNG